MKDDRTIAADIRTASGKLSSLIAEARTMGLRVDVEVSDHNFMSFTEGEVRITNVIVKTYREIR